MHHRNVFVACALAALVIAPLGASASSGTAANAEQAAAVGSVQGTVADETGAPISGAAVILTGPVTYSTASDAKGDFTIAHVEAGLYNVLVSKPGYDRASQTDLAVFTGEVERLAVRMNRQTFTSLRTIASIRVNGRGAINTSAASIDVVSPQTFANQSATQVTRVLSQVPGVQISFPSNSANAAAPGAITVPNIRDAESYETASLIDGHPISVGQYGDNVTTFINSYMLGSVETIKGPGADSPVINNAVGGTLNFRTKDPTLTPEPDIAMGIDSHGGTFSNFGLSDTISRLGFVVDVATLNDVSPLNGKQVYYDPANAFGSFTYNGATFPDNSSSTPLGNTASNAPTQYPLVACCYTLLGNLDQTAELFKFRYRFSGATTATVSYLGSQSYSDQNANTSDFIPSQFTPGAGYAGSLPAGALNVSNVYPGSYSGEFNNEPIFQAEASSTLGNDTVLARFYHATINRYQFQGNNQTADYQSVALYGTTADSNGNPYTFNGQTVSAGYNDYYREPELDRLSGGTFEYVHPIGSATLSFSADRVYAQSSDYSEFSGPFYSFNLPPGTNQTLSTYLLRGHFFVGKRLDATVSDYLNTFQAFYPNGCAGGNCNTYNAAVIGSGVTFGSTSYSHNDPRLGLVYRPSSNSSVRLALGSGIVPPFSGLLNVVPSAPVTDALNQYALETTNNAGIKPETSFGYDLGGDLRLHDGTVVSADLYLTNLYNRFFSQTVNTGQVCSVATPCQSGGGGAPITSGNIPIYSQTNANISNARFQGLELSVKRAPEYGLGFELAGSLQRGYFYNLPGNFYCSFVPTAAQPCTPANYNQNLNIIAGENTNGVPVGFYNVSYNGNMRIPYFQGNAQISYTFKNKAYLLIGETLYGKNNSLNEPPFGIGYATLRYPLRKNIDFQISGDNIFNAYPGYLPIYGGGVAIPLANGQTAATTGNVLGPATYRFSLDFKLP